MQTRFLQMNRLNSKSEESIFHFCQERKGWWCAQLDTLIILGALAGAAAIIIGSIALSSVYSLGSQHVINTSGTIGPSVMGIYATTSSPITFNLPSDLTAYVGKTYHVDFATFALTHKIEILPGGASWLPSSTALTASCTAANCGISFRVVAADKIRVISSINFSFA